MKIQTNIRECEEKRSDWLLLFYIESKCRHPRERLIFHSISSHPNQKVRHEKILALKKQSKKEEKKFYVCPQAMIYAVRKSVCYHWLMWFSWHNFFLSQLFNLFKQTFQLSTCVEKYHIFIKLQKMLCNSMKKVSRRPIEI